MSTHPNGTPMPALKATLLARVWFHGMHWCMIATHDHKHLVHREYFHATHHICKCCTSSWHCIGSAKHTACQVDILASWHRLDPSHIAFPGIACITIILLWVKSRIWILHNCWIPLDL